MTKLYGVVVQCTYGCEHLIGVGKTSIDAWANAPPKYAALRGARTIRIGANAKSVRLLRNKHE